MYNYLLVREKLLEAKLTMQDNILVDGLNNKYAAIFNGQKEEAGRLYDYGCGLAFVFTDGNSRQKLIETGITIPVFLYDHNQISIFEEKIALLRLKREQIS